MASPIDIFIDGKKVDVKKFPMHLDSATKFLIKSMSPKSKSMKVFLQTDIRPLLRAQTRKVFRTHSDPDGKPWAKLSAFRTMQRRKKGTLQKGILNDSSNLWRSIKTKRYVKGETVGLDQYTDLSYAWVHQPPRNPPKGRNSGGFLWVEGSDWTDNETNISVRKKPPHFTNPNGKPVKIPNRIYLGFGKVTQKKIGKELDMFLLKTTQRFFIGLIKGPTNFGI